MDRINHFSHIHPLLLEELQKNDEEDQVICSGCEEPISGCVYSCAHCNYVLHKSCAELPRQMKHPMHPQHPLTLLSTSPYSGRYICNACRGIYKNFVYHCSLCNYDLDMACASLWRPDDGHSHAFVSLTDPQSFVCYACGDEAKQNIPCLCTVCQIWVHSGCAQLPQSIRINGHRHRLRLNYSLHQVYGFRDDINCNACNGAMSTTFAGYFCSTCRYLVHLKCPEQHSRDDWQTKTEVEKEQEQEDENQSHHSDSDSDQESYVCNGTDNPEKCFINHDHELTLMGEQSTLQYADKLCGCCIQPITPPFFSCAENCGFLLHQSCAELPKTKEHQFHAHPLTLLRKAPPYDGIFRCDGCKSLSNGFVYRCEECQFDLDVCCGSLPETLKHRSHKHPLLLQKSSIARQCKGCHLRSNHVFVCDVCDDFAIDCGCATLPSTAWHMYDKHPLCLRYSAEGDLREHGCDICREKRSPKQWFYYCDDCDFAVHTYCVIGKSKRVKFGGTFQYDAHPQHPLALVEEIKQQPQPPCEACRERCIGWTLECGKCKWYMHREGRCFWEQFKQSTEYLAFSGTMRDRYAANVLAATPNVSTK